MPFRDYLEISSELVVRTSEVESTASGLAVGRLEVWPPRSVCGKEVNRLIKDSGLDVIIVRASTADSELTSVLNTEEFVSWQADTLLYFTIHTQSLATGSSPDSLVPMTPDNESEALALVERAFLGYRNHYSANPVLSGIDVVTAYQDWTRKALSSPSARVFKALDTKGVATGICVTDISDQTYDEILLGGIVLEERGRGAYPHMIKMVGARAHGAGKELVVISTQASNVGVIRAWCRLGFLPTITLNTIHVVRRDIFRAASGDK